MLQSRHGFARRLPHTPLVLMAVGLVGCSGPSSAAESDMSIRISLMSVPVDDQAKALDFYTNTLGFEKKHDRAMGGPYRWLTVTSPAGPEGVELLLEPNAHPATQAYQSALYADGIPHAQFFVDDLEATYERLEANGVRFKGPPARMGEAMVAILDDTCGNWIILTQELPRDDDAQN